MSLSYHYAFTAPADTGASALLDFLRRLEVQARRMAFEPTMVLDAAFDSDERLKFARRLTTGFGLQDPRLKNVALNNPAIWEHDSTAGSCHLLPERGVLLVVTDEAGAETIFGFFRFPEVVTDVHGNIVAQTQLHGRWWFSDFVDSPDPRFRTLVRSFAKEGYLEIEKDEFAGALAR